MQEHADAFDSLPSKVVGKVDHRHIGDILDAKQLPGVDSKSPSFVQFACLAASEVRCFVSAHENDYIGNMCIDYSVGIQRCWVAPRDRERKRGNRGFYWRGNEFHV